MKTTTSQHGERCLRRRSWSVGIATALLAAAPYVASAQNNGATGGENSSAIGKGVDDLPGHTFEELQAGITSSCSYDDPTKVYFLYNVGTGKFLNMGGYWGVHASLKDYPMPLWTLEGTPLENGSRSLNFTQNISTTQGSLMKWVTSGNPTTDVGVFCDRNKSNNSNGHDGWFFKKTTDSYGKDAYVIYTFTTPNPSASSETDGMYLTAFAEGQATADKNCGADTYANLFTDNTPNDYSKWRLLTLQDFYDLLKESSENLNAPIDFTFYLKCPGFERGRTDINGWQTFTSSVAPESYYRIGLQEYNWKTKTKVDNASTSLSRGTTGEGYNNGGFLSDPSSTSNSYSFPCSGTTAQKFGGATDYLRHMGKFFCMDVHGTHGYIYQKMFVKHAGTYVVQCKAYSNTPNAHLFAGVAGKDGQGVDLFDGSKRTTMLSQVSNMTEAEKARLHVADKNMDYAGKEFYETNNYINSVTIDVTQDMIDQAVQAGAEGACIALGLYIGNPNDPTETPDADEWTVFDEFRVLYASNVKGKDLVLDELRGDLNYLKEGVTYKNSILHLAKTFTMNRWNSFVLPVDLTANQLRTAFGNDVRLAKLKTLTETELQFETVNLNENTNVALEVYQPYIIFPTKTMDQYSPYTATISETNKVVIQGEHFRIPNVTFKMTADGKNDLSQMDESKWTSQLTHDAGAITAYGTFVRTFDPDATQNETTGVWTLSSNKGTIREGYDKLIGSYFFDQGNVYFSDTQKRGLRGFSCWFKPKNNEKLAVYIDGEKQEAALTAIGELIIGPEAANRYGKNNGVYNLQGQRVGNTTEGLPSGIYIVNGRKYVVR